MGTKGIVKANGNASPVLIFGPIILIWITCLLSTNRREEAKEQSKYKGNFLSLHGHLLVLLWINLKDLISNVFHQTEDRGSQQSESSHALYFEG